VKTRSKFTILFSLALISTFLITACSKKTPQQPQQRVLVKIGDKRTITYDEFIERAEYTIRPPYAKGNSFVDKKVILNSLIAEKLMAIEAGDEVPLLESEQFQNFINGRKEQEMRRFLFHHEGTRKANVDTNAISTYYRWAGREYEVEYFTVMTPQMADSVLHMLNEQDMSFEEAYSSIVGDNAELPTHTIDWDKEGSDAIIDAVYSDTLELGQIVGPVQTEEGIFTTMRIKDWTTTLTLTDEQVLDRWDRVSERVERLAAEKAYAEFVGEVMRGKEVDFDRDTFFEMADILKDFYIKSPEERKQSFNAQYWHGATPDVKPQDYAGSFERIKDQPLLTIDGETWTVDRFRDELARHPLVFRKRNINNANFPYELRLAVVDLIRDKYLTEVAYDRGYDEINIVKQEELMWRDNAVANFHAGNVLREMGSTYNFNKNYLQAIDEYLNSYVDSLQTEYSDQIGVNIELFKDMELTRIDMFVMDKNVPFPVKVPQFPHLTTDTRLDYGYEMTPAEAR